jgi:glutathione synthase/RimK-type ligase-like ATP-grasp enzyme
MVVLWGVLEDGPLSTVYQRLQQYGVETAFIDQRKLLDYCFESNLTDELFTATIFGPDGSIDLTRTSAIYLRQYDFSQLQAFRDLDRCSEAWGRAARFEDAMLLWCELSETKVVNRPSAMGSNGSKPYQLELIMDCGFNVPDTLLTTDPDCVLAFWKEHRDVIYKSISSRRSIVGRLTERDIDRIPEVASCPTQFQQYVNGIDYRVHVLEEKIFAAKILSTADDYRYSPEAQIVPALVPSEIAAKCVALTKRLGLFFSGIDLRQSVRGEWFCFEANPSPGFTYFDDESGQIATALAMFLVAS